MITEKSYKSQLLETIAIRASFPMERLQDETKGNYRTDEQGDKEPLQHLYNIVQATDEGKQARFLAQLQVDELQLLQALSLPDLAEQVDGSAWVTLLSQILSQDVSNPLQDPESRDRCFYPGYPRPFEDLFLPFINYGRHEFQESCSRLCFSAQYYRTNTPGKLASLSTSPSCRRTFGTRIYVFSSS